MNYIRYNDIDCVMPFMFTNDIWILLLNRLLKNERNPVKHVYGSVFCAWQSGRHAKVYENDLSIIEKYLQSVVKLGITPNFTFSSMNINNDKINDKFSNDLLDLAHKYKSYFIISSEALYNHIKKRYNDANIVSSVIFPSIKVNNPFFNETRYYNKMLDKCEYVVVRPEYAIENINKLDKLIFDVSRLEILVNQTCHYNCPNHGRHYSIQENSDLFIYNFQKKSKYSSPFVNEKIQTFCPRYILPENKYRSVRMSVEQVEKLMALGIRKIKFQGRECKVDNLLNDLYEFLFTKKITKEKFVKIIESSASDIVLNSRNFQFLYLFN